MFESITNFFKGLGKNKSDAKSKDAAKERLHLVLMQDRANISADFLALMKQEIIEVIKKYIDVDENAIDVKLTNKANEDGTTGAPVLYANIPIVSVKEEAKEEARKIKKENENTENSTSAGQEANNMVQEPDQESSKKTENDNGKEEDSKETEEAIEEDEVEKEEETDPEPEEVIEKAEEIVEELKEENTETK